MIGGAIAVLTLTAGAQAERRLALVIGNSNYRVGELSLSNPKNDAQDVAAALRELGFDVDTAIDATKRDMDLAFARFARGATSAVSAVLLCRPRHAVPGQQLPDAD
jgi:hypothetical protein